MRKLLVVLALCLLGAGIAPAGWAKDLTYFAIADSYAFGFTTDKPKAQDPNAVNAPSFGEPGYVAAYAQFLSQKTGTSVKTVNLAIPGESTDTFYTGGSHGAVLNLNYYAPPGLVPVSSPAGVYLTNAKPQYDLLLEMINQAHAQNRDVYRITIHLGGNDLQVLLSDPEYVFGSDATRAAKLLRVLARVASNYERLLAKLREKAPEARVVVLSYPNAFRALDYYPNPFVIPGVSYERITTPAVVSLNALLAVEAARFGARYVDLFLPFFNHEAQWTYILDPYGSPGPIFGTRIPNAHPNVIGYGVIANLLKAQE